MSRECLSDGDFLSPHGYPVVMIPGAMQRMCLICDLLLEMQPKSV